MQDFHYNYSENKCGDKTEMSLTNADSFMYKIESENVFEDFCKDKELFEFSTFTKDSKHYNNANNLVAGRIEDETRSVLIKIL